MFKGSSVARQHMVVYKVLFCLNYLLVSIDIAQTRSTCCTVVRTYLGMFVTPALFARIAVSIPEDKKQAREIDHKFCEVPQAETIEKRRNE